MPRQDAPPAPKRVIPSDARRRDSDLAPGQRSATLAGPRTRRNRHAAAIPMSGRRHGAALPPAAEVSVARDEPEPRPEPKPEARRRDSRAAWPEPQRRRAATRCQRGRGGSRRWRPCWRSSDLGSSPPVATCSLATGHCRLCWARPPPLWVLAAGDAPATTAAATPPAVPAKIELPAAPAEVATAPVASLPLHPPTAPAAPAAESRSAGDSELLARRWGCGTRELR